MSVSAAYDDDVVAWAEQQASSLRALADRHRSLPNELDLIHIAEEIEDVGKSQVRVVQSLLRILLVHLVKAASTADEALVVHWRAEATGFHNSVLDAATASMRDKIDLDLAWRRALREAAAALAEYAGPVVPGMPETCPFALDVFLAEGFDFNAAVSALRNIAATAERS